MAEATPCMSGVAETQNIGPQGTTPHCSRARRPTSAATTPLHRPAQRAPGEGAPSQRLGSDRGDPRARVGTWPDDVKDAIIAHRCKQARNIAKVAAGHPLLPLVHYGCATARSAAC